MLKINDLHAQVADREILKGFNFEVNPGEVHAFEVRHHQRNRSTCGTDGEVA